MITTTDMVVIDHNIHSRIRIGRDAEGTWWREELYFGRSQLTKLSPPTLMQEVEVLFTKQRHTLSELRQDSPLVELYRIALNRVAPSKSHLFHWDANQLWQWRLAEQNGETPTCIEKHVPHHFLTYYARHHQVFNLPIWKDLPIFYTPRSDFIIKFEGRTISQTRLHLRDPVPAFIKTSLSSLMPTGLPSIVTNYLSEFYIGRDAFIFEVYKAFQPRAKQCANLGAKIPYGKSLLDIRLEELGANTMCAHFVWS